MLLIRVHCSPPAHLLVFAAKALLASVRATRGADLEPYQPDHLPAVRSATFVPVAVLPHPINAVCHAVLVCCW